MEILICNKEGETERTDLRVVTGCGHAARLNDVSVKKVWD